MVGTEARNFDALRPGWVEIYYFKMTDLQKVETSRDVFL